jgi:hypothetical protein
MGMCYYDAKMLWEAHLRGVSFQRILTLGHQSLFLYDAELRALRNAYKAKAPTPPIVPLTGYKFGDYSDRFFREILSVATLEVLDYSGYQGATIIHDLNQPIPADLAGSFDAVVEAGTLEHIFNFPVAVGSLMRMVKVGGSIFLTTASNNLCGHGFYQFSPELIYRIFSPQNGFELRRVVFLEAKFAGTELSPIRRAYEVVDPKAVGMRVGLMSSRPVMITMEAQRIKDVDIFAPMPQQSDYAAMWNQQQVAATHKSVGRNLLRRIKKKLSLSWQNRIDGHRLNHLNSLANRKFYKRLS